MDSIGLSLIVESKTGKRDIVFPMRRLVVSGWTGRNKEAVQAHIDELAKIGVPGPARIPVYINISTYLETTSEIINVVSKESSGEVEFLVLKDGDQIYIGVGSDHTDREFEKFSIPLSKQMCAKIMAPVVWLYEEVKDHWDHIILRSWTMSEGKRILYQEGVLANMLGVEPLLEKLPKADGLTTDGLLMYSGTFGTKGGLICSEKFDFEMEDPVLERKILHGYEVKVFPQYI